MGQQSEATGPLVTQDTMDRVLGSIQQSDDSMGQVVTELREMKQLLREHNAQIEQQLREHNALRSSIGGTRTSNLKALTQICAP